MNKNRKKIIQVIFCQVILLMMIFCSAKPAKADFWSANEVAAILKQQLEEAVDEFKTNMLDYMKGIGMRLLKERVEVLVSGKMSGRALVITDYEEFIYDAAKADAYLYAGTVFNSLTRNASTSTSRMVKMTEIAVKNELIETEEDMMITIDDQINGGIENMFNERMGGGLPGLNLVMAGGQYNNPYILQLKTRAKIQEKLRVIEDVNRTQAIAGQGFTGRIDPNTNLIDLPGSIAKEMVAAVKTMPMTLVATAENAGSIAGMMASNLAITLIESEITKITRPMDNQLMKIRNSVRGGVREIQRELYQGTKFVNQYYR